jgi:transposase
MVELFDELFGIQMSLGAVTDNLQAVSEALAVPVQQAHQYAQTQAVAYVDETGWREQKHRAWLWVMATQWVTVFLIAARRSGAVAKKLLGSFKGVVVTDRWNAYHWLSVWQRQLCWAHLLREWQRFIDRGGRSKIVGKVLLYRTRQMFRWWHKVRDGTRSRAWFVQRMPKLQRQIEQDLEWGADWIAGPTGGTCRDILALRQALWTFVRVEGVEPTNNSGEQKIRHGVMWRKTSFGTDSERGSRFVERILTVRATLRQQGRSVLEFLTEAIRARSQGVTPPSLLPQHNVAPAAAA